MSTSSIPLDYSEMAIAAGVEDTKAATQRVVTHASTGMFQVFVYLQLLDLLTTLVGFRVGAAEASPFIRVLMHFGPAAGVFLSKLISLALGALCVYTRRLRLIRWMNLWFGALVVWNLLVILSSAGMR
jgi:hypothetical protein